MHGAFHLQDAAGFAGTAGLYMLGNHIDSLYDYLVLLRAYLENLTLLALFFA